MRFSALAQILESRSPNSSKIEANTELFIARSLTRQGALDAVERILKYGKTESGRSLNDYPWFRDQLRLTADNRLKHVLTSGASQVSKSLANYLVAVDTLISGGINIGWFYASRQSMYAQQPEQFQKIAGHWLKAIGYETRPDRESTTRYSIANATGNFSYANSSSEEKSGGAAEGKEQASFSVSQLFLEEKSSWRSAVDVTPRLGASLILSKPIRELGTPGAGRGIESAMSEAAHLFCPAVICRECDRLTFLDPKGALLKPVKDAKTGKDKWFTARGEIMDYWTKDSTPKGAYVACTHCGEEVRADEIGRSRLYCRKTKTSAEDFLNTLPDGEIFGESVAIYLSPLLRLPTDPYRAIELVKEGLDPENPAIYCQNKLGHQSELSTAGVSLEEFKAAIAASWTLDDRHKVRVAGIDQGRENFWIVVAELDLRDRRKKNILLADAIAIDEVISTLDRWNVNFALIDSEPDRLSAYDLCRDSGEARNHPMAIADRRFAYRLALADQRTFDGNYKPIKVQHGRKELPCYAVNNDLFKDAIAAGFTEGDYRIIGKTHRKLERHLTSVKRSPESGTWQRPPDHDDDLFFAWFFMEAAAAIIDRPRGTVAIGTGAPYPDPSRAIVKDVNLELMRPHKQD